jgi:hypothetical protein
MMGMSNAGSTSLSVCSHELLESRDRDGWHVPFDKFSGLTKYLFETELVKLPGLVLTLLGDTADETERRFLLLKNGGDEDVGVKDGDLP